MVLGKKVQTQAGADMKTKKQAAAEPFAVVPLALMTFAQLGAALKNHPHDPMQILARH
jgi:hypothetical protein